jgi:hypothetical protein
MLAPDRKVELGMELPKLFFNFRAIASSRKSDAVRTLEEFMALRPDLLS